MATDWIQLSTELEEVIIPEGGRPLDDDNVRNLMESIKLVGLRSPINCSGRC